MNIWCQDCCGSGECIIDDYDCSGHFFGEKEVECTSCGGYGYIKNEAIEYEARIGRGIINAKKTHVSIPLQYTDDFVNQETIDELLRLGKSEGE